MKFLRLLPLLLAVLLLGSCGKEERISVDLFYTADMQGFFYARPEPHFDNREAGGYAVLKNFLQKQQGPYILIDGGNWLGSAPEATLSKGSFVLDFLKTIPFSVSSLSEQDFVYGWPSLRGIIRELPYPFIVSNLSLENQIPWPLHDYQIITLNGIKIAFFGLVSPETTDGRTRLTGMTVLDPLETARKMTALLKEKGVHYIVLLSSLGEGKGTVTDEQLADEISDIDLILSANLNLEEAETKEIGKTLLVYPGAKLDSISRVTLFFDKNKIHKESSVTDMPLLKETYQEESLLAELAQKYREETRKKMDARISQTKMLISTSLTDESLLGNLLADCLAKWSKLDGAILNSDSIRSPIFEGKVTEYDVYKMYPYGDNITFITIKGKAFKKALEQSLNSKDNFPQIGGFKVEYSVDGQGIYKIKKITLNNGRIVRDSDTYHFAITDHILSGGFGHDGFIDSLEFKNTFVEARQIMRSCLIRQKEIALPSLGRWKKVK